MSAMLQFEDFEVLKNGALRMHAGDASVDLQVLEVTPYALHSVRQGTPFSVVLRHDGARAAFAQGIYRFDHPQHGALDLFVVPIGPDASGMRYEIVFN